MALRLESLVDEIERAEPDPLRRVALAKKRAAELRSLADQLLDRVVNDCRAAGVSWEEVGPVLADAPEAEAAPTAPLPTHREHHGKYQALWRWLRERDDDLFATTFGEIEDVLGFPLPASCRAHLPHWYGYEGSAVARAIIDAGWRARNVDLANESLLLVRDREP
jgi:hypothetical protein